MDTNQTLTRPAEKSCIKPLLKIFVIAMIVLNAACILLFVSGAATFFGKTVDITYSIEMALGIFSMGKGYYKGIFGSALGIMYFVFFVLMLKDFISSLRYFKLFGKNHTVNLELDANKLYAVSKPTLRTVFFTLVFIVCNNFVNTAKLTPYAKIILAVGVFVFVLSRVLTYIMRNYSLKSILINCGYLLTVVISSSLVLYFASEPVIEEFISALNKLVTLFDTGLIEFFPFVHEISEYVILFLVSVFTLSLINCMSDSVIFQHPDFMSKSLKTFIVSIVLASSAITLYVISGGNVQFEKLISVIIPFLPLLFGSGALYFVSISCKECDIRVAKTAALAIQREPTPIEGAPSEEFSAASEEKAD